MNSPQPTPHDIISPPGVPYSPSLLVWLTLLFAIAVLLVVTTYSLHRLRQNEKRPTGTPEDKIMALLALCKRKDIDMRQANALARSIRRYISLAESQDITGYSKSELQRFAIERKDELLSSLINALVPLEDLRYRGVQTFETILIEQLDTEFKAYAMQGGAK